jgi:hypothetical protein
MESVCHQLVGQAPQGMMPYLWLGIGPCYICWWQHYSNQISLGQGRCTLLSLCISCNSCPLTIWQWIAPGGLDKETDWHPYRLLSIC